LWRCVRSFLCVVETDVAVAYLIYLVAAADADNVAKKDERCKTIAVVVVVAAEATEMMTETITGTATMA